MPHLHPPFADEYKRTSELPGVKAASYTLRLAVVAQVSSAPDSRIQGGGGEGEGWRYTHHVVVAAQEPATMRGLGAAATDGLTLPQRGVLHFVLGLLMTSAGATEGDKMLREDTLVTALHELCPAAFGKGSAVHAPHRAWVGHHAVRCLCRCHERRCGSRCGSRCWW